MFVCRKFYLPVGGRVMICGFSGQYRVFVCNTFSIHAFVFSAVAYVLSRGVLWLFYRGLELSVICSRSLASFFSGVCFGYRVQVLLRGLGFAFRKISCRLLRFGVGYSKKLMYRTRVLFKIRVKRKLKLFIKARSLRVLTHVVAKFNLLKQRSFYTKYMGVASIFEKLKIVRVKKGL